MDEEIKELREQLDDLERRFSNAVLETGFVRTRALLLQQAVQILHRNAVLPAAAAKELKDVLDQL